jgi:hypothetical protein
MKFTEVPVGSFFLLRGSLCRKIDFLTYVDVALAMMGEIQATGDEDGHIELLPANKA